MSKGAKALKFTLNRVKPSSGLFAQPVIDFYPESRKNKEGKYP
ncbi:hypothetical protein EPIR_2129 [Erwinia piriflorinigrans CFBP 5888]|uniref:Uncharacterized protein n=1 Tax=Erwinia piriflorinigrans CFBP 5888 TaxID=1161919 RepID=V5Z8F4_9GAMM|nr:hypothetical protein EPIR_2129 [Erwinia piriflorinigrans CFBP 5888]